MKAKIEFEIRVIKMENGKEPRYIEVKGYQVDCTEKKLIIHI